MSPVHTVGEGRVRGMVELELDIAGGWRYLRPPLRPNIRARHASRSARLPPVMRLTRGTIGFIHGIRRRLFDGPAWLGGASARAAGDAALAGQSPGCLGLF